MSIEITKLKDIAHRYSHSIPAMCLLADISRLLREEEASKTLSLLQQEINELRKIAAK